MNFDIIKNKSDRLKLIIKLLAILLVVMAFGKLMGSYIYGFGNSTAIENAVKATQEQINAVCKELPEQANKVKALSQNGIFVDPKSAPKHPQAIGILGNAVLISGKWCKVGDQQDGATILEVNPKFALVKWQEKELKLYPMEAQPAGQNNGPPPPEGAGNNAVEARKNGGNVSGSDDSLAWMNMQIEPRVKRFILRKFGELSPEQLEEVKKQWAG